MAKGRFRGKRPPRPRDRTPRRRRAPPSRATRQLSRPRTRSSAPSAPRRSATTGRATRRAPSRSWSASSSRTQRIPFPASRSSASPTPAPSSSDGSPPSQKRFKEAAEKARAAIDACPDSLSHPPSALLPGVRGQPRARRRRPPRPRGKREPRAGPRDRPRTSPRDATPSAVVVALKHLKAMAIIDGKVLDLPLFPDIRGETMDPGNFGLSTRLVSRKAKSIKLDTHRDAERAASIRARTATDAARRFGVSRGGEKRRTPTRRTRRWCTSGIATCPSRTRGRRANRGGAPPGRQISSWRERRRSTRAADGERRQTARGGDARPDGSGRRGRRPPGGGGRRPIRRRRRRASGNPAANRVRNAGGEGRPEAVADAATASKGSKGRSNGATNGNGHGGGGRADRGDKRTSAASSAATERARANKAAHQLVKRYWKSRVEADPGAILELTDIPVAELREFFSGKTGGKIRRRCAASFEASPRRVGGDGEGAWAAARIVARGGFTPRRRDSSDASSDASPATSAAKTRRRGRVASSRRAGRRREPRRVDGRRAERRRRRVG